jgi:hypothetical protein
LDIFQLKLDLLGCDIASEADKGCENYAVNKNIKVEPEAHV